MPLAVRGRSLGALTLVHAESGERFDRIDLAFAQQLAAQRRGRAGNARLYEQRWRPAHTPQAACSRPRLPVAARLRHYRPQTEEGTDVHVGGDLYDIVAGTTAGRWGFVVAEVCGKGAEAAALTALCHTVRAEMGHAVVLTTRALAYRGDDGRLGTVMFGHA